MNKYILCYKTPSGNRPCKNYCGEYVTGIDKEDVDINSTEYWEDYKSAYGEENLVILENKK